MFHLQAQKRRKDASLSEPFLHPSSSYIVPIGSNIDSRMSRLRFVFTKDEEEEGQPSAPPPRPPPTAPGSEEEPPQTGKFWLTSTTGLYVMNSIAVVLHLSLLITVYVLGNSKSKKVWHLKQDRIYAAPVQTFQAPPPDANAQIVQALFQSMLPNTSAQTFQAPFLSMAPNASATCSPAQPNYLNFSDPSSGNATELMLWVYAQVRACFIGWFPLTLFLVCRWLVSFESVRAGR